MAMRESEKTMRDPSKVTGGRVSGVRTGATALDVAQA